MAMAVTQIATAAAALAWMFCEWLVHKKPSVLGIISGAVAGLVAITPASGFVGPVGALMDRRRRPESAASSRRPRLRSAFGYDDALDVFGVHCRGWHPRCHADRCRSPCNAINRGKGRAALEGNVGQMLDPVRRRGRHLRLVRGIVTFVILDRRQHAHWREGQSGRRSRGSRHQPAWRGGAVTRDKLKSTPGTKTNHESRISSLDFCSPSEPRRVAGAHFFCGTAGHCRGARHPVTLPPWRIRTGLTSLDELVASPFARLAALLDGIEPGAPPIDLSLGEPRALIPSFLGPTLEQPLERVRPLSADPRHPGACARPSLSWLGRRYPTLAGSIDAETQVLPLNGSREGLFSAIFPALARKGSVARPAVLIPNPFYQAYAAAAAASGAEPVFLDERRARRNSSRRSTAIDEALLRRTVALYLCSPSNPQGAVADRGYLAAAIALARRFDFMLFADECYSEIYSDAPPPGALETAFAADGSFANVVIFNSLSKRSGLPGLRSGFVAGDPAFIAAFARFRNVACPQVPLPIQHVSVSGLVRRGACRAGPGALPRRISTLPTPCCKAVTATGARKAAFFSGSTWRLTAGARRRQKPFGKGVVSDCCRELISPARGQAGSILAGTTSGLRSCTTPTPRARLWSASSPHWGRQWQPSVDRRSGAGSCRARSSPA